MAVVWREPTSRASGFSLCGPEAALSITQRWSDSPPLPKLILSFSSMTTTNLYFVEDKANCQVDGKLVWTGWQVLTVQESLVQKASWRCIMAWQEWTSKAAVLKEKTLEMGDLEPWCSWSQITSMWKPSKESPNHLGYPISGFSPAQCLTSTFWALYWLSTSSWWW